MIGRPSSFLGVAVSDHSIACAEVTVTGTDRRAVRRTALFVFPPEASLDSPEFADPFEGHDDAYWDLENGRVAEDGKRKSWDEVVSGAEAL